jgi:hypothetical protein
LFASITLTEESFDPHAVETIAPPDDLFQKKHCFTGKLFEDLFWGQGSISSADR